MPKALTPEQTDNAWPSPDGASLLVHHIRQATGAGESEAAFFLHPNDGSNPKPIPWLRNDVDSIVGWSQDSKSLLVSFQDGRTFNLSRVELASGKRELLRTVHADRTVGTTRIRKFVVADDLDVYTYEVARQLSWLFLIRPGGH